MRKIGGFAAICAILLLSLAPAASQAFEHARIARVESPLASLCATNAQASRDAHHEQHDIARHLHACDYCDLIAHAPAPPASLNAAGFPVSSREVFNAASHTDAPRRASLSAAQPRAPPACMIPA